MESEETKRLVSNIENVCASIDQELGVPQDAAAVDVLSLYYKNKEGKPLPKIEETRENMEHKIYIDGESLYLVNLKGKFAFPLSSLKAIHEVKAKLALDVWNKKEGPKEGYYSQFPIFLENGDGLYIKTLYLLELSQGAEALGICFPCYELPLIERLTGMKAQPQKK